MTDTNETDTESDVDELLDQDPMTIKGRDEVLSDLKAAIPEAWTIEEARTTGNFKQILHARHDVHGEIKILPYKSYAKLPGFPDSHQIYHDSSDGRTVVARGDGLGQPADALAAAVNYMLDLDGRGDD